MGFYVQKKEYINKTFRLEKKMVEELEKLCEKKNISMNNLVSQCIEFALKNLEEKD